MNGLTDDLKSAKEVLAGVLSIGESEIPDTAGIENLDSWTSIGHMRLIQALESRMGRKFATEEILEVVDLVSIQKLLRS